MPRRPRTHLTYRPALDGLRGIAVLAVVVFHLWSGVLPGGWLGVDLFFVLSGYLITTLLVREYVRRGRVDLIGFWTARMRRLLPSLIVVLLAVLVASASWTLPSRRGSVAHDVLATFFYYANWHFLLGDEAYFASNGTPSPLRHAWSLAIEEQYYVLFPLLLLFLARFLHRRRHLAVAFAGLAALSAIWMAVLYVPGVDPTRVYYGTDTRAFELLIGAAAGAWIGPSQWGHRRPQRWLLTVEKAAWPALAVLVLAFVVLNENTQQLYRGGLVIFCVLALVCILAAASPHSNSFQRALSFEWLRRLGLVSYALYLWHWPLHVYLTPDRLGGTNATLAGLVQIALALVLSIATYRLIDNPIRRGGLRALLPRFPALAPYIAGLAALAIIVGSVLLPQVKGGGSSAESGAGGQRLTYHPAPYTPGPKQRLIVVGNSIPHSLMVNFPASRFPDLSVGESTSFGCSTVPGQEITKDGPQPTSAACANFHSTWYLGMGAADTALYFTPQNLLHDYELSDGKRVRFGTPDHDALVRRTLDDVLAKSKVERTKQLVITDLSCHEMPTFGDTSSDVTAINDIAKVKHLNDVTKAWTQSHHVTLLDQYAFLCPHDTYHGTINGSDVYADGLHFTSTTGPIWWSWAAPQLQKLAPR